MAQTTTGVRAFLSRPAVYDAFQLLVGAGGARRIISNEHLNINPGDNIVDVGCGTGTILEYLPQDVRYFGFDLSPEYIEAATRQHGARGTFVCKDVASLADDELPPCQVALAIGLLHHLDDAEAKSLLETLYRRLAPGGRVITVDPVFWAQQSPIARWLISRDRGRNVRTCDGYRQLVPATYSRVSVIRRDNLLNIPYSHAVMECSK